MTPGYRYRAELVRVTDADTIICKLDLGLRTYRQEALRLRNIDAPETSTPEGKAAKRWLMSLILPGARLVVETHQDRQTFNRYVADCWLPDGRALTDLIVEAGHATRTPDGK